MATGRKTKELGLNEISISLIIVVAVSCSDGGSSGAVAVAMVVVSESSTLSLHFAAIIDIAQKGWDERTYFEI